MWSHGDGAPNREHVRRVPFSDRVVSRIDITTNWRTAKYPDALPQLEELGITRAVALLGATGESDPRKAIDLIASRAGL